jgi:hypothetical protein
VRVCAGCRIEDDLIYDFSQPCRCKDNGYPIGETVHDATKHDPGCSRLRHRVSPYMRKLRTYRQASDGVMDETGRGVLPDEFAYLKKNGFGARVHSGFLWAEKLLCRACIIEWEQRQQLKRDYDARCAALQRDDRPHEYEQMICF